MTLVVDCSAVVAALTDAQSGGDWARGVMRNTDLVAPYHLPVEFASTLRRHLAAGALTTELVALARINFADLALDLHPYAPYADRVWELRDAVTPYDAWYVAVAEGLGATLATLDRRLSRAPGPTCDFLVP